MKKMRSMLAALLAVMMLAGTAGISALADAGNEFGIDRYAALGDSMGAGVNADGEKGTVPRVPTGEKNEDGTDKMVEIFGTSEAGYVRQLAEMLGLSGSGRVDTIRPDDQFRSWAYAGLRTVDILAMIDPSYTMEDPDDWYTPLFLGASQYEKYQETIIRDLSEADLITLEVGANDYLTDPMLKAIVEQQAQSASEEETMALMEAEEALEEGEDSPGVLQQLTDTLETINALNKFMGFYLPKMTVGYQRMLATYPRIVARLRELNPDAQIVLQGVPNPIRKLSLTNNGIIAIGQIIDGFVTPGNLDIMATAARYGCRYTDILTVDCDSSVHPTTEGYKVIAERIMDQLQPVKEDPTVYEDVEKGSWYESAVNFVTEQKIMTGTGDRMFSPDAAVTRGTVAQILYAAEGKPEVAGSAGMKDVKDGEWYCDAVNWCVASKLAAGYTDGTFRPNDPVTRQQLAAMLYRYAEFSGKDTSASADLRRFADADDVSEYAVTAMKWAVAHGLISGTGRGLEPKGTATRAQLAVILKAFYQI